MTKTEYEAGKKLLESMKRIRCLEEAIAARYGEGKMRCPTHLSIGQEAPAAAVGLALTRDDQAVSTHRAHAHYIGKGGNLRTMMAEIYGKATGCCKGKGGSMHLIDLSVGFYGSTAIVGNSIPVGVGLGLTNQYTKNGKVSTVFLGDATLEEGAFHEAVNFAVVRKLPVLFVCENNFFSVYSPLSVRQPQGRAIWKLAEAHGIKSAHGDGNNAWETYQLVLDLAAYVRKGNGPAFVELETYRWREHCGPNFDNDIGYRSEEEYLAWKKRDPVPRLEKELAVLGLKPSEIREMDKMIQAEVDDAFKFAEESPFPEAAEAYQDLFAGKGK